MTDMLVTSQIILEKAGSPAVTIKDEEWDGEETSDEEDESEDLGIDY